MSNKDFDANYSDRRIPSPQSGQRGCLCWDTNTYSVKCCNGSLRAQGIGSITRVQNFLAQENGDLILQEDNYNIKI